MNIQNEARNFEMGNYMKIYMITRAINFSMRPCFLLYAIILLCTSQLHSQIGTAVQEDRIIVGSSGDPELVLPFLERTKVSDKLPYYTLWYWDDSHSEREVKFLEFYASELELDYLYEVLKAGFEVKMQRIEVGKCRIVTHRPIREGNPLKVVVYYEDDSSGTFYLRASALERLLGKYRNPKISYLTGANKSE